jgi:predicted metalloprotease with PDZ domain
MSESYRYTVRIANPLTHYAEVEARFPSGGQALELFLAVWTPGSYLVREYSRHVEDVTAFDESGRQLQVRKTRKNRWLVESKSAGEIRVNYRIYCHELSVRTNWVDEEFALLHGAATFLSVVGALDRPHAVRLELPEGWKRSVSGLARLSENEYLAPDYDTLVDSPILIGNPAIHEFEYGGKRHYLVNSVDDPMWDMARSVEDTRKIIAKNLEMWGSLPYNEYWFLNILVEEKGGGGLEHKNSCCLTASRYATRTRAGYIKWLELVSHEFFHVWNVKRLRPVELGPFDYENENYTRGLWVAEGFTEYYGSLIAARAGLLTREEYLGGSLSGEIETLQTTPGRFTRSADLSSFDTWIKLYRPDENSINSSISYYTKGGIIAFLADAKIRAASGGARSLDDVMREAYQKYSGDSGYGERAIQELTGMDITAWIEGTEELDYSPALDYLGLRFKAAAANGTPKAWLGIKTKTEGDRLIVTSVPRETPAYDAGFSADDEVLAINGSRVLAEQFPQRMEQLRPKESAEVLVSRRGKVKSVPVTLGEDPGKRWTLEVHPETTEEQKYRLNAWLGQLPQPE